MKALLKMAEANINDLLPDVSYAKWQKLTECVLTRNSKQYLGKAYTEEQMNEFSAEEFVDKLFSNYEAKLSGQIVKSLGKSIIRMYLMGPCGIFGMSNQDALSKDLESDPFLTSALQRFTCELHYRFGLQVPKMETTTLRKEASKQLTRSKYVGLGAAIAAELMIGFWFSVKVMLAIGVAGSLNHFIGALTSSK